MFETELINAIEEINNINDNFGSVFEFFSMNYLMLVLYKSILYHALKLKLVSIFLHLLYNNQTNFQ